MILIVFRPVQSSAESRHCCKDSEANRIWIHLPSLKMTTMTKLFEFMIQKLGCFHRYYIGLCSLNCDYCNTVHGLLYLYPCAAAESVKLLN